MKFLSLEPFIPSGPDFDAAKAFFQELGFSITWDAGDYAGFANNGCKFILQKFDDRHFAENLMVSVHIPDADAFHKEFLEKKLTEKFGVRVTNIIDQPYGREVNVIDKAGVCWHFVQG